ncbi:hypothetical protein JW921_05315 [Candidatus Fermentibacterales bacterium]|nr:hypothetical protein [Candidatus Fermentibacterales bacterium]
MLSGSNGRTSLAAVLAALCALSTLGTGCGGEGAASGTAPGAPADWEATPLLVLLVEGSSQSRTIMDELAAASGPRAAATVLSPSGLDGRDIQRLLAGSAMERGLLIMTSGVELDPTSAPDPGEIMSVQFGRGDSGLVMCEPPALLSEVTGPAFDLSLESGRQASLVGLLVKYMPELSLVRLHALSEAEFLRALEPWQELAASGDAALNLVLIAPGKGEGDRAWVLMTGPDIVPDPGHPLLGLTTEGLLSTCRMLLGLPWMGEEYAGIPAISVTSPSLLTRAVSRS